jgi:hypothetical protein
VGQLISEADSIQKKIELGLQLTISMMSFRIHFKAVVIQTQISKIKSNKSNSAIHPHVGQATQRYIVKVPQALQIMMGWPHLKIKVLL